MKETNAKLWIRLVMESQLPVRLSDLPRIPAKTYKLLFSSGALEKYYDINPECGMKGQRPLQYFVKLGCGNYPHKDEGYAGKKVTQKGIDVRIAFLEKHGYTVTKNE